VALEQVSEPPVVVPEVEPVVLPDVVPSTEDVLFLSLPQAATSNTSVSVKNWMAL
jgi:hypothetical protein